MLDVSVTVSAKIAGEGHDDDLFEERDRGDAHLCVATPAARIASSWELHDLFFDIVIGRSVLLINGLREVHVAGCDLRFPLSVSLKLLQELVLLLLGLTLWPLHLLLCMLYRRLVWIVLNELGRIYHCLLSRRIFIVAHVDVVLVSAWVVLALHIDIAVRSLGVLDEAVA